MVAHPKPGTGKSSISGSQLAAPGLLPRLKVRWDPETGGIRENGKQ